MEQLAKTLQMRFGDKLDLPPETVDNAAIADREAELIAQAEHYSVRRFSDHPVSEELLRLLAATALCSPSKSDLQQRDIIIVTDDNVLAELKDAVRDQPWTQHIPSLIIFVGNNNRQRRIHQMRGHPFANDHLDAFFNAAVDAAIALQAFIHASETIGLKCCPISGIRNQVERVHQLLNLPSHTFPIAGLAAGWPASSSQIISQRLSLAATVHINRFNETAANDHITEYDRRRLKNQQYAYQRNTHSFGALPKTEYSWSEDKARQYSQPERSGFGEYVESIGFKLT